MANLLDVKDLISTVELRTSSVEEKYTRKKKMRLGEREERERGREGGREGERKRERERERLANTHKHTHTHTQQ